MSSVLSPLRELAVLQASAWRTMAAMASEGIGPAVSRAMKRNQKRTGERAVRCQCVEHVRWLRTRDRRELHSEPASRAGGTAGECMAYHGCHGKRKHRPGRQQSHEAQSEAHGGARGALSMH